MNQAPDPHPTRSRAPIGALAALVVLAVIWGGSIPATKLALADMRPVTLTALRYLLAAPLCLPLLLGRPVPPRRALAAMLALGVLSAAIGQLCQVLGVSLTAASVATVIGATIPILFVLLAALRLGQRLGSRHLAGLVSAFVGVSVVAVGDPGRIGAALSGQAIGGDALMLVSAVAVAIFYIGSTELSLIYPPLIVAAWTTLGSALAMVPAIAAELAVAPFRGSAASWAVAAYLAALVTVAGTWIWLKALARVPARVAAALQYLQPLVGVGLSALLFGDRLDAWFAAGTALVFVGIALTSAPARGRAAATG